jgi:hypothetical protein
MHVFPQGHCTACAMCHNHPMWQLFVNQGREYFLGVCLRAATDPVFATFNGRNPADLTQEEVDNVLGMCYCTREEAEAALTPDTVVLCSHRSQVSPSTLFSSIIFRFPLSLLQVFLFAQVREWDSLAIQKFHSDVPTCTCEDSSCTCGHVHAVLPQCKPPIPRRYLDAEQCHTVAARANHTAAQKFLEVQPRFDTLPYAAVGGRTMLLRNISPQQHMMNGSCGTITAIQHDDNKCPTSISVEFDDAVRAVPIRRTTARTLLLDGHNFRKTTFPLALCYAMTGHKAQGATICSPVIIDIKSAFAAGLVYTMLTRVTSRSHLRIIGRITVEMLRVAVNMHEPDDDNAEKH